MYTLNKRHRNSSGSDVRRTNMSASSRAYRTAAFLLLLLLLSTTVAVDPTDADGTVTEADTVDIEDYGTTGLVIQPEVYYQDHPPVPPPPVRITFLSAPIFYRDR